MEMHINTSTVYLAVNAMADHPISRYSEVIDLKYLTLYCDEDECENIVLILEGEYATIPKPTYKLICPKCKKIFHTTNKPGLTYTLRK